jgi:hypothetical protein
MARSGQETWPGDLSAQHEDLGVVGRLAAGEQAKPADELTEDQ